MKQDMPETQKRLLKEFPEIGVDKATEIDIRMKTEVLMYQSESANKDISILLQAEVNKYVRSKNEKLISRKCNKLAACYWGNNKEWVLQENWYCLLAYFITIATMILRVMEVNQKQNDWISLILYFVSAAIWIIIVQNKRFMGLKAERFLIAFNHHAPSMIIVNSMVFYITVCSCDYKIVWCAVIALFFTMCVWLTWLWYCREMKRRD